MITYKSEQHNNNKQGRTTQQFKTKPDNATITNKGEEHNNNK